MAPGQERTQKGGRELHFSLQSCTRSACILTLHPVILPFPYLVLSHLFGFSACILHLIFTQHPLHCYECVYACVSAEGHMFVCMPEASPDKMAAFPDALVVYVYIHWKQRNRLKQGEWDFWVAQHSSAQVSLLFTCLISLAGKVLWNEFPGDEKKTTICLAVWMHALCMLCVCVCIHTH